MTTRIRKERPDPKERLAIRERQSAAASILTKFLGPLSDSHPELWAHRTFLLIVGKVYEHLVLCKKISTKEFVELTRTLAESCKSDARLNASRKTRSGESTPDSTIGGVVAELEEMVRQIYGTNLHNSETAKPELPHVKRNDREGEAPAEPRIS